MSKYTLTSVADVFSYNNEFDNAWWTKLRVLGFGSGSIANAIEAPDGTMTADLVIEDASSGSVTHGIYRVNGMVASGSGEKWEMSVYAKSFSGNRGIQIDCGISSAFGFTPSAQFHISSGTVVGVSSGEAASITDVGDGWWRCAVTSPRSIHSGTGNAHIYLHNSGDPTYVGNSTSGIYLWNARLRKNEFEFEPEWDIKLDDRKIETVQRTTTGAMYRYLWGKFKRAKLSLEFISSADMTRVNSWWGANTPLVLFDSLGDVVVSGYLTNGSAPIDSLVKPYTDQFKGTIELESY